MSVHNKLLNLIKWILLENVIGFFFSTFKAACRIVPVTQLLEASLAWQCLISFLYLSSISPVILVLIVERSIFKLNVSISGFWQNSQNDNVCIALVPFSFLKKMPFASSVFCKLSIILFNLQQCALIN